LASFQCDKKVYAAPDAVFFVMLVTHDFANAKIAFTVSKGLPMLAMPSYLTIAS
jgi:hypothetical protein